MKSKRILLPENRAAPRKQPRAKKDSAEKASQLPFLISQRQRSEAVGLVMIGVSAFSLSLLHYLNSAKISGLVNSVAVYLGLGLYILPVLIGIMGIQRFMERSFQNRGARIMGTIGAMTFGLGLLGLEGGKVGTFTFSLFASRVGPVPAQVLFLFLFLASLIFALDILYKDLLGFALLVSELLARLAIFIWEGFLAGLALGLGAVRETVRVASLIASRVHEIYRSYQPIDEVESNGKLLPFSLRRSSDIGEEITVAEMASETALPYSGPPMGILGGEGIPTLAGPEPAPATADATSGHVTCQCTHSIESFTVPGAFPTCPAKPPANPVISDQSPSERRMDAGLSRPSATPQEEKAGQGGPASPEKSAPSKIVPPEPTEEPIEDHEEEAEAEAPTEDPEEHLDAPVSLDDHPIDHRLKEEEGKSLEKGDSAKLTPTMSELPPLELLRVPTYDENPENDLSQRSALLLKTLEDFGLRAQVTAIVEGPAVSRFEIRPAPGVKVARITTLVDDIAMALAAPAIRIEAPIPGKSAMGIEIPNPKPTPVYFYDLIRNENFKTPKTLLNLALGMNINKRPVYADLAEMPHLLIAGSTGSGKSVCINTIIASILFQARPDQVKLVMIDPKMVELTGYNNIPHLISPVVTDPKLAADALQWAVEEMVRRYEFLSGVKARNISDYNRELPRLRRELDEDLEPMPLIVIIIDELADLMMTSSAQVEGAICRLSQMARAVGIHLVIATQRPSVDVLTGLIKANLPSRIAFFVSSQIDSRTIIDEKGAEKLLGKGDMLFKFKGRPMPLRVQGAYISDQELASLTEFVKQQGNPEYINIQPDKDPDKEDDADASDDPGDDGDEDSQLFSQIEEYLSSQEKTSTSMLQRKFKIGYNRAARIMDLLEEKGFVSPLDGSNKRRVLCRRSNP